MKIKYLISALLLFTVVVCYASTLDLSGKWTGNLVNPDSTLYPLSYNFTVNGSAITGTATGAVGTFPIDSGKIDSGNNFHFLVTVSGVNILHQGKFYTDSIGMNFNLNGSTTHCTLVRANN